MAFFLIEFILLFSHAPFYSFYSNFLAQVGFSTTQIGFLWSVGVMAEIAMFAYANLFIQKISFRFLVFSCLLLTGIRWVIVGIFETSFAIQFCAQLIHAFSFGLFHLLAMQVIFKNFSLAQQGRGQAFYSTVWGVGVAIGSVLAGTYWEKLSGELIFIYAGLATLLGLFLIGLIPNKKLAEI